MNSLEQQLQLELMMQDGNALEVKDKDCIGM